MSMSFMSEDGLDTLFWGFVLLIVGAIMSVLVIAHVAFAIVGVVFYIIGFLFCLMGVSNLRKDYRARVERRGASPPPPPQPTTTPTCPTCGGPLTYVAQYQRWYCPVDQKYV